MSKSVPSTDQELVIDALETAEGDLVLAVVVEEDGALVKLGAAKDLLWTERYELDRDQTQCGCADEQERERPRRGMP